MATTHQPNFSKALVKFKQFRGAASAVFRTYGLVEQILLSMPKRRSKSTMKTILLSQRVNLMSREVITRSKELQKVLWFAPCDDFEEPTSFPHKYVAWNSLFRVMDSKEKKRSRASRSLDGIKCRDGEGYISTKVAYLHEPQGLSKSHVQTESWRKMLLTQTRVNYGYVHMHRGSKYVTLQTALDARGTMEDVSSLLEANDADLDADCDEYPAELKDYTRPLNLNAGNKRDDGAERR
ncbi:hypothetical protein DOTSEDRAFT_28673 [Dothistroma septosporum NZE10]|uniref:Uncharacterized protein n=1 Tax=Dothistroma septosporum (strain NZE10 / CBS 128990) TaxID=675120 RepID=M2XJ99_DOTSN|nr:hypothetical protein DOTSEDRAFT_28673 [Dothistroma septosporum NZE10]